MIQKFLFLILFSSLFVFSQSQDWSELQKELEEDTTLGEIFFVLGRGKDVLFSYEKGLSNKTKIWIASATKWATSYIIGRVVSKNKLKYSDKVSDYVSWWNATDYRADITLSHLMSFTSGFIHPDNFNCWGKRTIENCVRYIYDNIPVTYQPGTVFDYGMIHMEIAGLMAEKATGKRWKKLMRKYLKKELGMKVIFLPGGAPNLAGGMKTRTVDYVKLLTAIYEQSDYLDQQVWTQIETDHTPTDTVSFNYTPYKSAHYGYGNWLECPTGFTSKWIQKWKESCIQLKQFSSPGKYGFYPWIDRVNGYWAILSRYSKDSLASMDSVDFGMGLRPLIEEQLKTIS